jgi:hypothetical protein
MPGRERQVFCDLHPAACVNIVRRDANDHPAIRPRQPADLQRQPIARQHLNEPVPEATAPERMRQGVPCPTISDTVDFYVRERVRAFLVRRHKVAGRGNHQFSFDVLHGECGVLCLERLP